MKMLGVFLSPGPLWITKVLFWVFWELVYSNLPLFGKPRCKNWQNLKTMSLVYRNVLRKKTEIWDMRRIHQQRQQAQYSHISFKQQVPCCRWETTFRPAERALVGKGRRNGLFPRINGRHPGCQSAGKTISSSKPVIWIPKLQVTGLS